jgi:hypothetical protein
MGRKSASAKSALWLRNVAVRVVDVFTVTVTLVLVAPAGNELGLTVQLPFVGALEHVKVTASRKLPRFWKDKLNVAGLPLFTVWEGVVPPDPVVI